MVHRHDMIEEAHHLLPQYPIVTFDSKGFSKSGKTMMEYAFMVGNKAMVIECGQKGFSVELTKEMKKACLNLISHLKSKVKPEKKKISVLHIEGSIMNENGAKLLPGFLSLTSFSAGQVLASSSEGEIKASFDGYLIFPYYEAKNPLKSKGKFEICNLCRRIDYLEKD